MKPLIPAPPRDEPRVPRAPDPTEATPQGPVTSEHAALSVIGELSLEILHEMGNLWTGVHGIAHRLECLPDPEHTPEQLIAQLRTMAEAGRALSHQLQEVAHRRPEAPRTVALDQLVADTVALVRQLLPKRFEVTLEAAPGEYRIWGVPAQLRLVLLTLATNARDAIEDAGHLAFTLAPAAASPEGSGTGEAQHIVLRLQDNGCGMSQERLARAFEPGYTRKREAQGSGYGLFHARRIVGDHRGHLRLRSEPGRGTCAEITLPCWAAGHAPQKGSRPARRVAPSPAHDPPADAEGTVLVVDDDPGTREVLRDMVTTLGYPVLALEDAELALQTLHEDGPRFDLLITDQRMPRMSGLQLAREARTEAPDLPIILVSGDAEDPALAPDLRLIIGRWLQKPVGLVELADAIHAVIPPHPDT